MRLKPEKIEHLAGIIYEVLAANPEITLAEERDRIVGTIKRILTEDMQAEDAIEVEAHKLLEQYQSEINRKGASYEKLFQRAKQKIAQERKMVI